MNETASHGTWSAICFGCLLAAVVILATTQTAFARDLNINTLVAPSALDDGWVVGNTAAAGFDEGEMIALAKALGNDEYSNLHSVLVEHDGKLVYEQYLSGTDERWGRPLGHVDFDRDTRHDLRSITKSVTSILLGIAIGSGYDAALDRSIFDFLPNRKANARPRALKVTLRQVLTMTSGFDWNEMEVPYSDPANDERRLATTTDPVGFVLQRPLREEPGKRWYYNGGLTMVAAGAIAKLTGKPLAEYAENVLFEPLQITNFEWLGEDAWGATGLPSAASGLRMTARDTAKIGSLMLNGGRWNGKQVVPETWVKLSGKRYREDLGSWSADGAYGYGFQWWHGKFATNGGSIVAIAGVGHGGQRLFVLPDHKLVVTIFSGNYMTTDWWKSERVMKRIIAAHH